MKDAVATMGAVLPSDAGGRDAVHVAVISVVAGSSLLPGQHVGFSTTLAKEGGENVAVTHPNKMLGVVDPFIKELVKPGERFWLYIYPRKITGLNHRWTHPDIPDENDAAPVPGQYNAPSQKLSSEKWLREFCERSDCPSYFEVVGKAQSALKNGEQYVHFNDMDAHGDIPPEFWEHLAVVTGEPLPDAGDRPSGFSCSC